MTANLENSEVATGLKKKAVFIPISKKGNVKDYSKQSAKQDQELTVDQIINFLLQNSDFEESRENC